MLSTCLEERVNVSLKTVLSRINLTDARHQVVQVSFGTLEYLVIAGAVLAPASLPTLALMADLPGGNDMLPFNACCAIGILARDVAAGFQVYPVAGVLAAAIELRGLRCIERPGNFLGLAEGSRCLGVGGYGKKQATHSNKTGAH